MAAGLRRIRDTAMSVTRNDEVTEGTQGRVTVPCEVCVGGWEYDVLLVMLKQKTVGWGHKKAGRTRRGFSDMKMISTEK